jgi:hypothetical protein
MVCDMARYGPDLVRPGISLRSDHRSAAGRAMVT